MKWKSVYYITLKNTVSSFIFLKILNIMRPLIKMLLIGLQNLLEFRIYAFCKHRNINYAKYGMKDISEFFHV